VTLGKSYAKPYPGQPKICQTQVIFSVLNSVFGGGFVVSLILISGCVPYEVPRERLAEPDLIPIVYSKNYEISLIGAQKATAFDLEKYSKIRNELVSSGLRKSYEFVVPGKISRRELLLVHSEEYLEGLHNPKSVARSLEAPPLKVLPGKVVEATVVDSFMYASEGTVLAGRRALDRGIAIDLAGGYAHASRDSGEGFNLIADVPIAIRILQREGLIERAMIVDTDVHKGNGNILTFKDDPSVYTFDMYEEGIYPTGHFLLLADKDIPLPHGTSTARYMELLRDELPSAIEEAEPDIIFYVAGSDPYYKDTLGSIQMSFDGMVERDLFVIKEAYTRKIPIAMVLSGGYSDESWRIHYESIKAIIRQYEK